MVKSQSPSTWFVSSSLSLSLSLPLKARVDLTTKQPFPFTQIIQKLLMIILKGNTSPADLAQSLSCVGFIINEGLRFNFGEEEQKSLVKVLVKYIAHFNDNETICILGLRQIRFLSLCLSSLVLNVVALTPP